VIAIAVKLESPGPVIYRSLRVGRYGRKFDCYKFRTMVAGSDAIKESLSRLNQRRGPFFKIADDPRVTRFGRFLRKYSLDELPQLWNVLKGDMSLVGPRPHPVEDCAQYTSEHRRRLDVIPGVTGLWQVMARANPSFEICMMLDLAYIKKWSLLLDCRILLKTIPAVLAGEGQ
jgi:lipopolysaccharide/colanic/teichoic acid biosynthesis glycosyltransferase